MRPARRDRARRQSWRRKLVFSAATAVLFVCGLEASLALLGFSPHVIGRDPFVGFANTAPLFEKRISRDRETVLATTPRKLRFFNAQQFPREKPPDAYRIFCVGGSTTFGHPYDDATSFAGWLRELLPEADASRHWEVVNAGGISYASYRVAGVMEELARYEPDLFIVYCGHNEFLEERTYREVKRLPPDLLRALTPVARTRTYAALHRAFEPLLERGERRARLPGEVEAVLDHTAGPELYQRDDRLRKQVLEHYRVNLARMIAIARSAGAEVLFVVPTCNLRDFAPFKSVVSHSLSLQQARRWRELHERAGRLSRAGRFEAALAACRAACAIDDRSAALQFRMGRILFELERFEESRAAFRRARDEDVCPLRAPSEFLHAVRRVGTAPDVSIVDFAAMVEAACLERHGHRLPGRDFFLDHVHPTIAANRMLAVALVDELIRQDIVAAGPDWDEQAIAAVARRVEERIDSTQHARALRNLAKVLTWAGKQREAGPLALDALRVLPGDEECLLIAGAWLRMEGRAQASFDHFRRAAANAADRPLVHLRLARVAAAQGHEEQARLHYAEVLRIEPEDETAQRELSKLAGPPHDCRDNIGGG